MPAGILPDSRNDASKTMAPVLNIANGNNQYALHAVVEREVDPNPSGHGIQFTR